jgi:glycosyltransferase involved in cell wall biosynthesis
MKADISVVICTRDRAQSIIPTLNSVLVNRHPCFEVIVIDQSVDDKTAFAVNRFLADRRCRYIRSGTQGLSVARNIGLSEAYGEIVVFTDDDCIVSETWLELIEAVFQAHDKVAVLNCRVDPAPQEDEAGFIPCYFISENRLIESIWGCFYGIGMGAGMAVRRRVILSIGGFDTALGAGAAFAVGEDHDIVLRALLHNWQAYELADTTVVHFGMRLGQAIYEQSKRDWYGLGATYIKPVRCGQWRAGVMLISKPVVIGLFGPFFAVFRLKAPHGAKRILYYLRGIVAGSKTAVNRQRILYQAQSDSSPQIVSGQPYEK